MYWVHIEFVYGRVSILPKHAQGIAGATAGLLVIFLAMLALAYIRTHMKGWRQSCGRARQSQRRHASRNNNGRPTFGPASENIVELALDDELAAVPTWASATVARRELDYFSLRPAAIVSGSPLRSPMKAQWPPSAVSM